VIQEIGNGVSPVTRALLSLVVTDSAGIRRLVDTAGWSIPGQLRLFPNGEREQATAWACEELDTP
jgi:hypothetical protein